jgi:trehalose/maltose hydrolase-like predicted phosphorylase
MNIRQYDRRLNLKAGNFDRELYWETPSGAGAIRTRRFLSAPGGGYFVWLRF